MIRLSCTIVERIDCELSCSISLIRSWKCPKEHDRLLGLVILPYTSAKNRSTASADRRLHGVCARICELESMATLARAPKQSYTPTQNQNTPKRFRVAFFILMSN